MSHFNKISEALLAKPVVKTALATNLNLGTSNGVTLKNKIIMSSLTRGRGPVPTDLMKEYYTQRATTGLILSEGVLIEPQGTEWPGAPGIFTQKQIKGWKDIVDSVHTAGGVMFAQLWHVGRLCHPLLQSNQPIYGPSAIKPSGGKFRALAGTPGFQIPDAIEDPAVFVEKFRLAAVNSKAAGFDGVELHSANGYLPNEFLDSGANVRTDKYGGTPENRARFVLECIDAFISVYGPARVGIKISPCGGSGDMIGGDKELPTFIHLVKELENRKIGYVQIVRYVPDFFGGTEVDIVKHFRPLLKNTKLFINGGFTPDEAEQWLKKGDADAVVFGRHIITTPDFAPRAVRGVEYNKDLDFMTLYPNDPSIPFSKGYTDYPFWGEPGTKEQQNASEALDDKAPHN